jgi:hypothetical protein
MMAGPAFSHHGFVFALLDQYIRTDMHLTTARDGKAAKKWIALNRAMPRWYVPERKYIRFDFCFPSLFGFRLMFLFFPLTFLLLVKVYWCIP